MSAHPVPMKAARRVPALVVGGALVGLGLSGLLDDTGALTHPPWTVAVLAALTASAVAAWHTVRQLVASPDRSGGEG